jgi:hypothetical protein
MNEHCKVLQKIIDDIKTKLYFDDITNMSLTIDKHKITYTTNNQGKEGTREWLRHTLMDDKG